MELLFLTGFGGLLFGYLASSNTNNESAIESVNSMIDQNKEFVQLSSTIEVLNREIEQKSADIIELEGQTEHHRGNIERLLQRADFIRNSGELAQLEELAKTTKNLTLIKQTLSKIQNKHVNRFNIGVLVSLVQNMYQDIHNEELDILGVQDLMMNFTGDSSDGGADTFGEMNHKPSTPKRTRRTGPGV